MIYGPFMSPRPIRRTVSKHAAGRLGKKRPKRRNR